MFKKKMMLNGKGYLKFPWISHLDILRTIPSSYKLSLLNILAWSIFHICFALGEPYWDSLPLAFTCWIGVERSPDFLEQSSLPTEMFLDLSFMISVCPESLL